MAENGPLLGFAKEGTPLAPIPHRRGYRAEDFQGKWSGDVDDKAAGNISAQAYALYRGFEAAKISWRNILAFVLRDNVADVWWIVLLAALVGLLGLVTPKATQLIFDYAIPGGLDSQLWQLGAGMLTAALGTAAFNLAQGFLLLRVESKADRDVQSGVMDRLLRLPVPFFRLYSVGDLANRALSIDSIRQIISAIGVTTLLGAVSSLFNFYILFKYGWQLATLAVCLSLSAMLVAVGVNLWSLRFARQTENLDGAINGLVNQLIAGIAKLRVTGTAAQAFALWAGKFAQRSRLHLRMRRIQNVLSVFNVAFPSICTMLIFWFAFKKIAAGGPGFTTGDFLAYNTAFGAFLAAALSFSDATIRAVLIIPLYERASPILKNLRNPAQHKPGRAN
jgi:ATP-binding cassette subfamily C protein